MQLKEIAYFTEDVPAMTDFYQRLFGAEPVAQSQGMAVFMIGETKVFIHRLYTP
jgi:catechol 2,3-dioxygenase-like lactoylglutathione lyase family enzyme